MRSACEINQPKLIWSQSGQLSQGQNRQAKGAVSRHGPLDSHLPMDEGACTGGDITVSLLNTSVSDSGRWAEVK